MADNQPPSSRPQSREILGLPIWAWGIGLGAFLIGVIYFFRQNQSGATQPFGGNAYPSPSPYPYPSGSNAITPGQTPTQNYVATIKPWACQYDPNSPCNYEAWDIADPHSSSLNPQALIPADSQVQITGPAVQGTPAGDPHHLTAWYPVNWGGSPGYVSAADIGGFQASSNQFGQSVNNGMTPANVVAAGGTA